MAERNDERSRAYRLRDIKSRNRRQLTDEEAKWLARYDKAHPPRGPRRPAELAGKPITDPGELGALRVETIPTSRPANDNAPDDSAPQVAPANDNAAPSTPEADFSDEGVPGGGTENPAAASSPPPPPLAVAALPVAPPAPPAFGNLAIAAMLAELFGGQAKLIADDLGYEVDPAHLTKAVDAYRAATLNTLNRYWPDSAASETGDALACGVGTAVVFGGPQIRDWLKKKKSAPQSVAAPARVPEAATPAERRTEAQVPEARADAVGSGY